MAKNKREKVKPLPPKSVVTAVETKAKEETTTATAAPKVTKKATGPREELFTMTSLAREISAKYDDVGKSAAHDLMKDAFAVLAENIVSGKRVSLHGFGTFYLKDRAARKGRNPQTGETITIPERKVLKFKPSSDLKNTLAGE